VGLIYRLNACPAAFDFDVYQPRNPKASAYYRCVEDHFVPIKPSFDQITWEKMKYRHQIACKTIAKPMPAGY
jgi:hypothetical protein